MVWQAALCYWSNVDSSSPLYYPNVKHSSLMISAVQLSWVGLCSIFPFAATGFSRRNCIFEIIRFASDLHTFVLYTHKWVKGHWLWAWYCEDCFKNTVMYATSSCNSCNSLCKTLPFQVILENGHKTAEQHKTNTVKGSLFLYMPRWIYCTECEVYMTTSGGDLYRMAAW